MVQRSGCSEKHRDAAVVDVLKPPTLGIPVLAGPTLMCCALVGQLEVEVVGVIGWTAPMQVHIASGRAYRLVSHRAHQVDGNKASTCGDRKAP